LNYKSIVYGGIPDGLGEKEFFEGYTIPRSKEIMRIYRDMELVEQLDSGKCSKPDGTPRKLMDVSKMKAQGWEAKIDLKEGIKETYKWFLVNETDFKEVKIN